MGAVDGFDGVAAGVFDSPTRRIHSYQQPLMFSLVLMCVRNCLACWRLANLKEELGEDAWPGLAIYIRHLRDSTSFNRFVLEMAAGVLQHKGCPPDVHAAAAANAGGTGVRDESTDTDGTVGILQVGTTAACRYERLANAARCAGCLGRVQAKPGSPSLVSWRARQTLPVVLLGGIPPLPRAR